jgi:hypothetical protein
MTARIFGGIVPALLALFIADPGAAMERARWDFTVYLDQKKIGNHSFEVRNVAGMTEVRSEANFRYTILMIPAYRYQHTAAERWVDNCLHGLRARTNANGDRVEVSGERTGGSFTVFTDERPAYLPECVMSFAYWNPDFLEQSRLLNPQTGEYVDVRVEVAGTDVLDVRGQAMTATRYRLTAYEVDLTLWYSEDNEWLGLESVAEDGRIIRYELS